MIRKFLLPTALACTAWASSASAEEEQELDLAELLNLDVSVGSMGGTTRLEVPYELTVATREDMDRWHVLNVPDALQQSAGFTFTGINTAQQQLSARGSNAFQKGTIRLLVNGNAHDFDIYNITPWSSLPIVSTSVSRIEVVKGAVPYYGQNALNGVVNIEMDRGEQAGTEVGFQLGSYGRSNYNGVHRAAVGEDFTLVLAFERTNVSNSFTFNGDHKVAKAEGRLKGSTDQSSYTTADQRTPNQESTSFYASLSGETDAGKTLIYVGGMSTPQLTVRLPDRICKTWVATESIYGGLNQDIDWDAAGTKHQLKLYTTRHSVDFKRNSNSESGYFGPRNPNFEQLHDSSDYEQPSYTKLDVDLELGSMLEYGANADHSISFTPRLKWTQVEQNNFFGESNITSRNRTAELEPDQKALEFVQGGASVQLKNSFVSGVTHTVDARADANYKARATVALLAATTVQLGEDHALRVSGVYMERAPGFEEIQSLLRLYAGTGSKTGEYIGNADLNPEAVTSAELGALGKFGHFDYEANGYFSHRANTIEMEYMGAINAPLGGLIPRYRFANANDYNVFGGNVALGFETGDFDIHGTVTMERIADMQGRLEGKDKGRYGDKYLPPLQANLRMGYVVGPLDFGVRGRFIAEHTWLWPGWKEVDGKGVEKLSDKTVNAYMPIDLQVNYAPSKATQVFAQVRNVTGELYNSWRFDKSDNYRGREIFVGAKVDL